MAITKKSLKAYIASRKEVLAWYMSCKGNSQWDIHYFEGRIAELNYLENDLDGLND